MITITPEAAAQIRKASETTEADDLYLRIAARREDDGSIEYGMGFDDVGSQDQIYTSAGVDVLIADSCRDLLRGATLDYVELDPRGGGRARLKPMRSRRPRITRAAPATDH